MAENVYKLELTMESRQGDKHFYVRRSFPAGEGKIEIRKYGYPCTKFGDINLGLLLGGETDRYQQVTFYNRNFTVYLNQFHTERFEYVAAHIDPYMKVPVKDGMEIIHATFYLYVE